MNRAATPPGLSPQRSPGRLVLAVGGGDALTDLLQSGAMRARMPQAPTAPGLEAVIINTAGGMTGGDHFEIEVTLAPGARVTAVGQACEKVYRAAADRALVEVQLTVAEDATLHWLPQPAILFDGSAFERRIEIDLAGSATLFAVEATILGRAAMGETLERCLLREHWRVRRDGVLAWAGAGRLDLPGDAVSLPSTLADGTAFATFVVAGGDLEVALDALRDAAGKVRGTMGASRIEEIVVATLVAATARHLMEDIADIVRAVTAREVPRVWNC